MFPPRTMLLSHTTVQPQKIIYLYLQLSGIENNLLAPCFSTAGFNLSRQMLFYIYCLDASTSMTQLLLLVYTTFEKCTFNLFNDLGLKTTCYLVHAPPCIVHFRICFNLSNTNIISHSILWCFHCIYTTKLLFTTTIEKCTFIQLFGMENWIC